MAYLLAGFAFLFVVLLLSGALSSVNPGILARWLRAAIGLVSLGAATFLAVRGAVGLAIPLALTGIWFLSLAQQAPRSRPIGGPAGGGGRGQPPPQRFSEITTKTLKVYLDLDSGDVYGKVLTGPYRGQTLEALSPADVADLWSQCEFSDPQSAQILEAYLDRRRPTWREDLARAQGRSSRQTGPEPTDMTIADARRILEVSSAATEADIVRAHKRKIMEHHPDRGGTDVDAARINRAKDVLLDAL